MTLRKLDEDYQHGANGKYFCKCCGYNTLSEFPNGTYEICKICFWEDDLYQTENPNEKGGPNRVSLVEARKNFEEFGVCEMEMKMNVRKPNENDIRKI